MGMKIPWPSAILVHMYTPTRIPSRKGDRTRRGRGQPKGRLKAASLSLGVPEGGPIALLGKQTGLSRPNDAALCAAAVAAQAQLRTSMTNVAVNVSPGYPTKCQMPQSTFFGRNFDLRCVPPPESPVVSHPVVELQLRVLPVPVLELPRGSAIEPLHSALAVPYLLSEETK